MRSHSHRPEYVSTLTVGQYVYRDKKLSSSI